MKNLLRCLAIGLLCVAASTAQAAFVDLPAKYIGAPGQGFLTTPGGVTATDGWMTGAGGGFKIAWNVQVYQEDGQDRYFQYTYTISNELGGALSKDLSHILIGVSPVFSGWEWKMNGEYIPVGEPELFGGPDCPYIPSSLWSIKFDRPEDKFTGQVITISFLSRYVPAWQDFYAKDGREGGYGGGDWATAYNADFGVWDDWTYKILGPDTYAIPVPGAALLGLIGLGTLGWVKRRMS